MVVGSVEPGRLFTKKPFTIEEQVKPIKTVATRFYFDEKTSRDWSRKKFAHENFPKKAKTISFMAKHVELPMAD